MKGRLQECLKLLVSRSVSHVVPGAGLQRDKKQQGTLAASRRKRVARHEGEATAAESSMSRKKFPDNVPYGKAR